MRDPVVDKEGNVGVGDEVEGLLRGGVGRHYYGGGGAVGRGREVGVVHERDVGDVACAGCEVKLRGLVIALAWQITQ